MVGPSRARTVPVLCTKHFKGSWATTWLGGHFHAPPFLGAWSLRVISPIKMLITVPINKYTTLRFGME